MGASGRAPGRRRRGGHPRLRPAEAGRQRRSDDTGIEIDPAVDVGPLYGVGLVTRLPVREWHTTRFEPAPWWLPLLVPGRGAAPLLCIPDEPRAAIAAVVEGPHGPMTVVTVHLSFVPGYNVRQLRRTRRWLAGLPRPLLLLGDFNLPGRLPAMVTGWQPLLKAATYPVIVPLPVHVDQLPFRADSDACSSEAFSRCSGGIEGRPVCE